MRRLNLVGEHYGRLTVVSCTNHKQNGCYMWRCVCDCGVEVDVRADHLKRGEISSCGCLRKGLQKGVASKHGGACDGQRERLYGVWAGMHYRCSNPHHMHYKNYGGRGIGVCEEWNDYAVFREWALANGYDEIAKKGACTLDRINNDGWYTPDNCRWVSMAVQNKNRRHPIKGGSKR